MVTKQIGNLIEISFKYNPALVSFINTLEGRTYNPATRARYIPLTGSDKSIGRLAACGLEVKPELREAVLKDTKKVAEMERLQEASDVEFETSLPLFPYQKVGAAFLKRIGSGLLGDEVGLGKTIQTLAVCESTGAGKVLVFTPSA